MRVKNSDRCVRNAFLYTFLQKWSRLFIWWINGCNLPSSWIFKVNIWKGHNIYLSQFVEIKHERFQSAHFGHTILESIRFKYHLNLKNLLTKQTWKTVRSLFYFIRIFPIKLCCLTIRYANYFFNIKKPTHYTDDTTWTCRLHIID